MGAIQVKINDNSKTVDRFTFIMKYHEIFFTAHNSCHLIIKCQLSISHSAVHSLYTNINTRNSL